MPKVIEAHKLHRIYETAAGLTHALRGVSLSVEKGEFLCIMGPSGSGKSTLMNILGCLDTPTSGSYKLEGLEVANLSDDDLAEIRATRLGFVFQSFNLLPRTTVLRNVVLPLIYSDIPVAERELSAWKARVILIPQRVKWCSKRFEPCRIAVRPSCSLPMIPKLPHGLIVLCISVMGACLRLSRNENMYCIMVCRGWQEVHLYEASRPAS